MVKLTTAQKNKRKRERKKRERAERLEQEKAAQKAKSEVLSKDDSKSNIDVDVEIEYVAEPLFPAANGADINGDTNMAAPAAGDAAANAEEDDGQDLQAVMRRFQDRASVTYVVTDEETNNEGGGDNEGSKEVKDSDDDALEDENGEMLSKRKLKVSFCAHLVLIIICFISFYCKYCQGVFALYRYCLFNDTYYYFVFIIPHTPSNPYNYLSHIIHPYYTGYVTTNSCTIKAKCITSRISRGT